MLKEFELENFKGFKKATLTLGDFTLLVGANGSGKSSVRDAFRFLHGISRGYTVSEIMGEKYGDGGERVWRGIRGGANGASFQGIGIFAIKVTFTIPEPQGNKILDATYRIEIGTLRFLAIMAALFEPEGFYFFEELENGFYPARMHLLLDLIERQTAQHTVQVVASSHSAHLLNLANPTTLESASFIYRLPEQISARIKPILSIPQARRVMTKPNIARLHAAGWLEHAVFFQDEEEEEV